MVDETYGVNPHQSVEGMVHEFAEKERKKDAALHDPDACDTPREEMEPSREAETMVFKGRLDANTGMEIPLTDKSRSVIAKQAGTISQAYLDNYEATFGHA